MNVGYKGLNVSADFAGQMGNSIYNGKQAIRVSTLNFEDRFLDPLDRRRHLNLDPRSFSFPVINYQPSDYFGGGCFFPKNKNAQPLITKYLNQILEKIKMKLCICFPERNTTYYLL